MKIKPEKVEDFLSEMNGRVVREVKKQKGIMRTYLLRSPNVGTDFVSLTLWEREAADEYGTS